MSIDSVYAQGDDALGNVAELEVGAFSLFGDGYFTGEVHRKFSYVTEILRLATNGKH